MKRYIRSSADSIRNYNHNVLDFFYKLGFDEQQMKPFLTRGNLRDSSIFGRPQQLNTIDISRSPHVYFCYYTYGNVLISGETLDVEFDVQFCKRYKDSDELILEGQSIAQEYAEHIETIAKHCEYVIKTQSSSHMYSDGSCIYRVTVTFRKPEIHRPPKSSQLDKYVNKYGLEFVFMIGRLFDKYLDADLGEQPYKSKIQESGCDIQTLKEIARYLHNNVNVSVSESGTYHIYPKSSKYTGASQTYELPYKEYNAWLGTNGRPRIKLRNLGYIDIPLED